VDAALLLKALRRRWIVVVVTIAVALLVGWLSTRVAPPGPPVRTYEATTVLLSSQPTSFGVGAAVYNIETIAALGTVGEVPKRVANALGYQGDPIKLTQQVTATGNPETGLLEITATSTNPEEARVLADTFGEQLLVFMTESTTNTSTEQVAILRPRINRLNQEIAQLNARIGTDPTGDEVLVAERDAKIAAVTPLYGALQQLLTQSSVGPQLTRIQEAVPLPVEDQALFQVRSTSSRLVLAFVLGLAASVGVVLIMERVDRRIRTKQQAEQHLDLPVLTEIPVVRRWRQGTAQIAPVVDPKSPAADTFRLLAAGITRRPPRPPKTILVTSPGPGDGKTTVVANLAATFAEVGKKVLVLSCDLRRPRIHTLFGVPNMSGLSELLIASGENGSLLGASKWRTSIRNVRLVPSGVPPEKPGELLSSPRMREVLEEAKEAADIVLLDTAPILAASDSANLLPLVDAVLLVVRAEKTLIPTAHRTAEILRRLKAPVVGATLNGAAGAELPRGYYEYQQEDDGQDSRRTGFSSLTRLRTGTRGS
jgi:capsular exopolysaccharide synthesis family protein